MLKRWLPFKSAPAVLTTLFICIYIETIPAYSQQVLEYPGSEKDTTVHTAVEVPPAPPGGLAEFMQWVGQQYRYPRAALTAEVKGRLQIAFVVSQDGKLTDFKVIRDLGYGTAEEAIRILKTSPSWEPGRQEGKPVRVAYILPIQLNIHK